MSGNFPWRLLITSAIIGTFCCILFKDPIDQLFAAFIGGILLGVVNAVFKIGLEK
jgi:hypothetical protein